MLLLPCALAVGCAPQPKLAVAPGVLSQGWSGPESAGTEVDAYSNLGVAFNSGGLTRLIARARAANADIGVARARVRQARAQLRVARAEMLPTVSVAGELGSARVGQSGSALDFGDAFSELELSWDFDLFGRARAGRRAARSRAAAAAFDQAATALAVEAEVARAYVQLAALGERIRLLDRNIASARELERVVRIRLREGAGTRVETGLQAIEVARLEAERLRLEGAANETGNALAVLVGAEAPTFTRPAPVLEALRVPAIAPVQPGALLVRRPDIRAAEARIRAAEGDIDRARTAFLPSLRLSASGTAGAASLGGPITTALSIGSALLAPIFEGGRLRGELEQASASQVETVELYRRALLTALAEAQDALSATDQARRRFALLERIVAEARVTARLTQLQYIEGETDLRFAIDAQQDLVEAEDARALALQERMNAAIDLYRAIGGPARG